MNSYNVSNAVKLDELTGKSFLEAKCSASTMGLRCLVMSHPTADLEVNAINVVLDTQNCVVAAYLGQRYAVRTGPPPPQPSSAHLMLQLAEPHFRNIDHQARLYASRKMHEQRFGST